jgi:phage terminase large subunit
MGVDDPEKLKSIVNVTSIWMEETTEFHYQDYVQVDLRLRGDTPSYKQIVLSFNPRDTNRWVQDEFFDGDGPKPELKDTTVMRSTWRDNMFIDEQYTKRLSGLKDKDETLWQIYDQGLWGVLEHIIYSNYEIIAADQWPEAFDEIIYGIDWGYNSPLALIEGGILADEIYEQELIYESGVGPLEILPKIDALELNRNCNIYADPNRPDLIAMLQNAGYNCFMADNTVLAGIDFVKMLRPKIHTESENLKDEKKTYKYKQNKAGDVLEEPVKAFDHLMDAERYMLYTHMNREGETRIY